MDSYSQLSNEPFKQILDQCIFVKKIQNTLYGEAEILFHKVHKIQIMIITRIFNRKELVDRLGIDAQIRMQIINPQIIRLMTYNGTNYQNQIKVREVQELCGSFYRIQFIYEYVPYTLFDEIQSRIKRQAHFTNQELENIITQIVNSLSILKQNQIRHGFIQPKHILFDKQCKLSDIKFMALMTEYQSILQGSQECYLSPEIFKQIPLGNRDVQNNEKNDVFQIGMTLLYCMTLKYPDVHQFNNYKVNFQKLNQYLDGMQLKYPVTNLVKMMLTEDPYSRPTIEQLIQQLSKNKENSQISTASKFYCENVEQKTIKKSLTPITHKSKSPAIRSENSFISDISFVQWEAQDSLQQQKSISQNQISYTSIRSNITPERQTKPCSSPFRSKLTKPQIIVQQEQFKIRNDQHITPQDSQRSINISTISYDFADSIKMTAPKCLEQEMDGMKRRVFNY
ncbi:hypothetical protein pb186bvf_008824 [Paramecium bursaria]